ncbi:hypothetical protein BSKO_07886 [Bryopsis sp. KO-2023]|nr:hypothetical protein BSKO_07886 [Bryopsis sp. KO-2023]
MVERPTSAFRRPASARPRPAVVNAIEEQAPPPQNDEATWWMFKSEEVLSVSDVATAGFANCSILDAARWQGGSADNAQNLAIKDLSYTFGVDISADSITSETSPALLEALRIAFCSHGSDLLIIVQNAPQASDEEDPTSQVVARIIDLINKAYEAAESDGDIQLAGVSVVLENYNGSIITGQWENGQEFSYAVQTFLN